MIRYLAIKNPIETSSYTYDICACEVHGDVMEILAITRDVTFEPDTAAKLVATLNSSDVDPLHLSDIIEDTLYDLAE